MSGATEADLRFVFRERADDVSFHAVGRVTAIDYRPRSHSTGAQVAMGAVVAVAIAAAANTALGGVGPATKPALASWSATPTRPASGQLSSADKACVQAETDLSKSSAGGSVFAGSEGNWTPVLDDVRGTSTLVILTAPTTTASAEAECLTGPGLNPDVVTSASAPVPTAAPGTISEPTSGGAPSSTSLGGAAGAGVTGVTIILADGTDVTATVANGVYAAWWPGDSAPVSEIVTTASGAGGRVDPSA
jgi:hypothetical protein